jgi:polar amino acid transport system substrate-binding protein
MRALSLASILMISTTAAFPDERPLRFSVSDSSTMPMIRLSRGVATEGILYELHRRIAEKVGRDAEQPVMSRARIQPLLAEGTVDVSCYVNPAWVTKNRPSYRWSVPFMSQHTVLVARNDLPAVDLRQLHGERIGTVLGFHYPDVDELFQEGRLIRDDARTENQVLGKVVAGRYRYALSTHTALGWFNRSQPAGLKLHVIGEMTEFPVHCIVRDEPDVPAREILDAMQQMQRDGEFEAILAKYQ